MNKKKFISLALIFNLLFYNFAGFVSVVKAQEATPSPTTEPTVESSPTSDPTTQPLSEPTPAPTIEPTPTLTPTMSPDEYDAWKIQKNAEDDAREIREDEWEAHEEDDAWIAAHGGD